MKTYTPQELGSILHKHQLWLDNKDGGERADLSNSTLSGADLTGAILTGAILTGADLTGAILTGADLTRANLSWAKLRYANLTGAKIDDAPEVPNLCQAILTKVEANPKCLEMGKWHNTCGTTHCLAGWAVHLAGEAGRQLESKVGHENAGIAIFLRSHGSVPNFYSSNDEALEWIRKEAAK